MKIVICGAGIAGLALARALCLRGVDVVIIEKAARPRQQGYMIDFFGPGYDAAEQLGVLPELRDRAHPIDRVSYYNERGRRTATMRYGAIARMVDDRLLSIMRPDIEEVLRLSLGTAVDLRMGHGITGIENTAEGVRVRTAPGEEISADLVVGADGIHSTVRSLTFGPERDFLRPLGFHTAAWVFRDRQLRDLVGDRWVMTDTVDAEVGLYGLGGDRVAAFGVHRTAATGRPTDPRAEIRASYSRLGWVVPRAVELCPASEEIYYDLVAQVSAPQWYDRRVVLLGDSCQAVSLIAGQGASLAVAAGQLLGGLLVESSTVDAALERYQRRWQPIVAARQRAGREGARWFLPSNRRAIWLRRLMMNGSFLPGVSRLMAGGLLGKSATGVVDPR